MVSAEHWVPVPGFEGRYEVSDLGRVRSLRMRWGLRETPLILSAWADRKGYLHTTLYGGDRRWAQAPIHQIVVLAFTGPRPAGMEVRHLDGDQLNNTPSNLDYGTPSENRMDAVRHGTHTNAAKTHCPQNHLYDDENTKRDARGHRDCRPCSIERSARRRREMRVAS